MIPENVVLCQTIQVFENTCDVIYVVNSSSLSKSIPWKLLNLIIEFEYDSESCWKQICSERTISHAFVKITDLPFKSLEEIQGLESKGNINDIPSQKSERSLIISSHIASHDQLLYLLESKFDFSLYIRQYKELIPHVHFADIVIDERSALLLFSNVAFYNEDFSQMLYDRVSLLQLKYETCWIIVQEAQNFEKREAMKQKSKDTHDNFLSRIVYLFHKVEEYKVKILHAQSIEETADLIKYIYSVSSYKNAHNDTTKVSISKQVTKEEFFLASFPCLNPYIIHRILMEFNLHEFFNVSAEKCCKILPSVPKRFIKCFYSTIQKDIASTLPDKYEDTLKFIGESPDSPLDSDDKSQSFQLKPSFIENSDVSLNDELEIEDSFESKHSSELIKPNTQYSGQNIMQPDMKHPDLSLQEIDLDYMSLKLSNKYDDYSHYSPNKSVSETDSISCHSSNYTLSPTEELKDQSDYQIMYEELNHPVSCPKSYFDEVDYADQQNHIAHGPFLERESKMDLPSSFELNSRFLSQNYLPEKILAFDSKNFFNTPRKRKNEIDYSKQQNDSVHRSLTEGINELNLPTNILQSNSGFKASQSSLYSNEKLPLNFKQFLYTPNKRKTYNEFSESSMDISPPHLKKPCVTHKGRISQTVSKQDFKSCNSPLKCQEMSYSPNNMKLLPESNMMNFYKSYC